MLFVGPHAGYQLLGITPSRDIHNEHTGAFVDTIPGIDAVFIHGGVPAWAQEMVIDNPRFVQMWSGLPDDVDRHTQISHYDTEKRQKAEGWDDETREFVEKTLLEHGDYGHRYILCEQPQELIPLPWPNYENTHYMQIVKVAKEIGVPFDDVLAYERAHKNRDGVIGQLEAELGVSEDDLVPA